jgi:hypothetical protein
MDELIAAGLAARGFLATTELLRHIDRPGLDRMVRRGELVRVRAGVYVDGARFRSDEPVARHIMAARAVAGLLGGGYAVSHLSAVALLGLPVLRSDLGRVHLSLLRAGQATRRRPAPGARDVARDGRCGPRRHPRGDGGCGCRSGGG